MTKKEAIAVAAREFFQIGLAIYTLLALAETLSRGTVSDYFDLNYVLGGVIIAGVLLVWCGSFEALLYRRGKRKESESTNWINAHDLRNLIRDRPKGTTHVVRGVPSKTVRRVAIRPRPKAAKSIDGVVRK